MSSSSKLDRCLGAFLGLAIGDAMGAPVEFSLPGSFDPVEGYRGGGPFNLPAGYWTDDTSMALCLADSLICKGGVIDIEDQMTRYANWYTQGYNSSVGRCFDIGNGTCLAIEHFLNGTHFLGLGSSEGNGSLMRLAPVPIAYHKASQDKCKEACVRSSLTTHNRYASELCGEFGALLYMAINGCSKDDLHFPPIEERYSKVENSGHAPKSLAAALYHFHSTTSFEDAVLQAVNYGDDADTVGAITGQLAGACYGLSCIPENWISDLYNHEHLLALAENLYSLSNQLKVQ